MLASEFVENSHPYRMRCCSKNMQFLSIHSHICWCPPLDQSVCVLSSHRFYVFLVNVFLTPFVVGLGSSTGGEESPCCVGLSLKLNLSPQIGLFSKNAILEEL